MVLLNNIVRWKLPTIRNLLASPLRRPKKLKRSPQNPPRGSLAVALGIIQWNSWPAARFHVTACSCQPRNAPMTKANFLISAINISSICFRLDAGEALYPVLLPGFQHVAMHPNHLFAASLFGTKEVDLGEGQVPDEQCQQHMSWSSLKDFGRWIR